MEYLLDTCTLLWAINDSNKMPNRIKAIINNPNNDVFVCSSSLWEIAIKHLKNPTNMPFDPKDVYKSLLLSDYIVLDTNINYIFELESIISQNVHRDPFDHILLAMAKNEKMTLITSDEKMTKYQGVKVLLY